MGGREGEGKKILGVGKCLLPPIALPLSKWLVNICEVC